jgi:hypothetical protein
VVLAASACETARLLLNSKSPRFPNGLANSSGVVGKYLTDTTGTDVAGYIPRMVNPVPHNEDGTGGGHLYMPWWLDNKKLDFPRGYHIEVWGGLYQPSYGFMGGIQSYPEGGGYGKALKDQYRKYYAITVKPQVFVNMVPDHIIFHRMYPMAADRTIVECDWLYLPSVVEQGKDVSKSVELFDRVNRQDFDACERCQPAMSSRVYRDGGVLVPSEHHIGAFHDWLQQKIKA